MAIMGKIWENARKLNKVIALPEGSEPRTLKAAEKIKSEKLATVILLGNPEKILKSAKDADANIEGITIVEPKSSDKYDEYVNIFYELRKSKGVTLEKAKEILLDEIYFATMMVKTGDAYGLVSGAIHSTGDLLRPALQIIKTAPGITIVSSSFIMETHAKEFGEDGVLVFADCA
ncbi:MAG: phosphate acyltransferase, partial [Ignavibacteriae bacterium]|nr:phosphate acyltransferase [Ignavibacteriota bacterium]